MRRAFGSRLLMATGVAVGGALVTAAAQTHGPGTQQVVAGRVVSAVDGRGLPGAQVTLIDTASEKPAADTTAGPEGAFRFAPVPAGRYRLSGSVEGYVVSAYLHHDQYSSAVVTGAGLPTGDLVLTLTPQGEIHGHVVSESGEPVEHAQVQLFRQSPPGAEQAVRQTRQVQTDDLGEFDFAGLVPGRFFLVVQATPWYAVTPPRQQGGWPYLPSVDPALQVVYPLTYYPNGRSAEEASPIEVRPGDSVAADVQLTPEPGVTISLQSLPRQPGRGILFPQLQQRVFGREEVVPVTIDSEADGALAMVGVPSGEYMLQSFSGDGKGGSAGQMLDARSGSVTVDVHGAPATAMVRVAVHVAEGGAVTAGLRLALVRDEAFAGPEATVDEHGVAEFKDVSTGDYRVRILGGPKQPVIERVSIGGHVQVNRRVHVGGTEPVAADVLLARHTVEVRGTTVRDGAPAVAAMVILVPAGNDTGRELFRRDQSDTDGGFLLSGVVPGDYILVALQDGWNLPWTDETMLRYLVHGVAVRVPETGGDRMGVPEPVVAQAR